MRIPIAVGIVRRKPLSIATVEADINSEEESSEQAIVSEQLPTEICRGTDRDIIGRYYQDKAYGKAYVTVKVVPK